MTDIELLEKAAAAVGWVLLTSGQTCVPGVGNIDWNPLEDDGDALRLAIALELEIRVFNGSAHAGQQGKFWCTEHWFPNLDRFAAARRAIVRAAASMPNPIPLPKT